MNRMRIFCIALLVAAMPASVNAAPDDGFVMSDDGALMAGAVVASGRDVASSWYNPALLTHNDRLRADVSTSAYGVRWTRVPDALRIQTPSQQRSRTLRAREFLVVPTAVALGSAITEHVSIGAGFFTSRFAEPTVVVRDTSSGDERIVTELRRSEVQRRYHAGPLFGFRVVDDFDVGLALYGVYDKSSVSQRAYANTESERGSSELLSDSDAVVRSYGMQGSIGLRGWLTDWVSAGASLRTPTVVIFQRIEGSDVTTESTTSREGITTTDTSFDGFPVQRRPTQIGTWTVAAGFSIGRERWRLGLDAEGSPGRLPDNEAIGITAHWNVRLGMRWRVNKRWSVGGGVFTDRNNSTQTSFGGARVDMLGVAGGIRLRTPVTLGEDEREEHITLETTVGVRYAGGRGDAGGFEVVYGANDPAPQRVDFSADTTAAMHLLTVQVGSGFSF